MIEQRLKCSKELVFNVLMYESGVHGTMCMRGTGHGTLVHGLAWCECLKIRLQSPVARRGQWFPGHGARCYYVCAQCMVYGSMGIVDMHNVPTTNLYMVHVHVYNV